MKIKKITPRGFCHGVVDSIHKCKEIVEDSTVKKPIYMLGLVVHNKEITDAIEEMGIIVLRENDRLQMLEQIDEGTVIITAHGTSEEVFKRARKKGLQIIDTTCEEVYLTHDLVKEKLKQNYKIIYISKNGHPEQYGVSSINPKEIYLVENVDDISLLPAEFEKVCVTNQTTMNMFQVAKIIEQLKIKYPHIEVYDEICTATKQRQVAVQKELASIDFLVVVGDPKSNNSQQLVKIAQENNVDAKLISTIDDLEIAELKNLENKIIGVTSGASTSSKITNNIIKYLEQLDVNDKQTYNKKAFQPTKVF